MAGAHLIVAGDNFTTAGLKGALRQPPAALDPRLPQPKDPRKPEESRDSYPVSDWALEYRSARGWSHLEVWGEEVAAVPVGRAMNLGEGDSKERST
jgi:hypothetical protein